MATPFVGLKTAGNFDELDAASHVDFRVIPGTPEPDDRSQRILLLSAWMFNPDATLGAAQGGAPVGNGVWTSCRVSLCRIAGTGSASRVVLSRSTTAYPNECRLVCGPAGLIIPYEWEIVAFSDGVTDSIVGATFVVDWRRVSVAGGIG